MLAGLLRHRLHLQHPVRTPDGGGGYTLVWQNLATLWAQVQGLRAQERDLAMQRAGVVTHTITLRYRSGITTTMRLTDGTAIYDIRGVYDPTGRRERLRLLVEEVQ